METGFIMLPSVRVQRVTLDAESTQSARSSALFSYSPDLFSAGSVAYKTETH
jgi:hypothetical protein